MAATHGRVRAAPTWRTHLVQATLAVGLVLSTGFAIVALATTRSNTLLAAQLTADHEICFRRLPGQAAPGLDAVSEQERLADTYGWDLHIPPSSAANGVTLVGARRCLYAHGSVPHVLYDAGGQQVSLYVLEGVARPDGDVTTFGRRSRIWTQGTKTFVLVSDAAAGELTRAVAYVRSDAR
jgi:hypothetical protein